MVGPNSGVELDTLSKSVVRRIEQLILDGTLKPGGRLPSERQLSERLGISRSILREALRELRGRGVIETRQGSGSVVKGLVPVTDADSGLKHLFKDHPRTLYDLLEVREQLEGLAAYMAAERGTDDDFRRITFTFEAMEKASISETSPEEAAELDHAFHRAICDASHNPVLVHTLQGLMQLMLNTVLASVKNLYHRPMMKKQIDQHHHQIYHAVLSRQGDWAQKAAMKHIQIIKARLLEIEREESRLDRSVNWEWISEPESDEG